MLLFSHPEHYKHLKVSGSCLQGVGLCHGIAGNAYSFLSLYRLTQDQLWLGRAQQFALFMAEHWRQLLPVPDEPFSLFEVSWLVFQDVLPWEQYTFFVCQLLLSANTNL